MVVSREAKKKQNAYVSSGLRDHYSELFTWMAALTLKNAVTKHPEQISLRNYLPNTLYLGIIGKPKIVQIGAKAFY